MPLDSPQPTPAESDPGEGVRVDTWLWSVRQTKSRSLATLAARAGHVRINGMTVKAAQKVHVGDEVRLRVEGFDRILQVTALVRTRVGAPRAAQCYIDLTPERPRIAWSVPVRERGAGRPTKKERRDLDQLRGRDSRDHG